MSVEYRNLESQRNFSGRHEIAAQVITEQGIGAMAFVLAYKDAMRRIQPDALPLLPEPSAIDATVTAARSFAASMPEDRFWQALLEASSSMPRVAQQITNLDRVDQFLQDRETNADQLEFLIATSTMENPVPILEEFQNPENVIDQAEAVAFRDELLTFNADESEDDETEQQVDQPPTLDKVIDEAIRRVNDAGIETYATAATVLGLFPELRSDLTQLPRKRGKNGRMEVSREDLLGLIVRKSSKDVNTTPREISKRIATQMKMR